MAKNKNKGQEDPLEELRRLREENERLKEERKNIVETNIKQRDGEEKKIGKKKVTIIAESDTDGGDEESDEGEQESVSKSQRKRVTKSVDENDSREENVKKTKLKKKTVIKDDESSDEDEQTSVKKKPKKKDSDESDEEGTKESKMKGKKKITINDEEDEETSEEEVQVKKRKHIKSNVKSLPKSIDKLFPSKLDRNIIEQIGDHSFFYPVDTGNIKSFDNVYYLYVRVSTSQQRKEGKSIRAQQHIVKHYIRSKKGYLRGVFLDAGITGASINKRKAFKRMCEVIKDREKIVTVDFSRLGRTRKLTRLMEKFLKRKIYFVSSSDDISTETGEGQKQFDDQIAQAVADRNKSIKRVQNTLGYMSQAGKLRGRAPYGWINNKEKKKYVRHKKEQAAIKIMKEMRLQHKDWSWTTLCHELDSTIFPVGHKYEGQKLPKRTARRFYVPMLKAIMQREGLNVNYGYNFLKERGPQQYYRKGIKDEENTDSDTGSGSSSSEDERSFSDGESGTSKSSGSDESEDSDEE